MKVVIAWMIDKVIIIVIPAYYRNVKCEGSNIMVGIAWNTSMLYTGVHFVNVNLV